MTIEILIAFLVGAAVMAMLKAGATVQNPDPARWLRAAARSGVTIKVNTTENDGEWVLGFSLDENVKELSKQALAMRYDGRKIEAIKLVRERLGMGLKEAKDFVEAL